MKRLALLLTKTLSFGAYRVSWSTLLDIQPLLTDMSFRNHVLLYVQNEASKSFWKKRIWKVFATVSFWSYFSNFEQNRSVSYFHPTSKYSGAKDQRDSDAAGTGWRKDFNSQLIQRRNWWRCIFTLRKHYMLTSIQLAAMHRATQPEHTRKPFYLYVDEMHSFISISFVDVLAEARK